jgi:EAL domain-containing protein (putative c-di-GMP-specific phosphodiesterase class I)
VTAYRPRPDPRVRISMDDFGTGYSSLSYLRSFPFDKIKIDRSFIVDTERNGDSAAIIRAVADLGASLLLEHDLFRKPVSTPDHVRGRLFRDHALAIETTEEGIETPEELELVRRAGCTEVRGFLLSAPYPVGDVLDLIARFRCDAAAT